MDGHENPNENSSLGGSAPRRAIFSSGDTPTPAEPNFDQSSNSVVGPRLGGVIPAALQTPSTPTPVRPNPDAAYAAAHPSTTKSTATGDLVLGKTKKSEKWLVITLAVVLVAVVASLITWLVVSDSKKPDPTTTIYSDTEKLFNQYANYLLYGKVDDSQKLEGEYDSDLLYDVDSQISTNQADSSYWNKSQELLNNAIKSLSELDTNNSTKPQLEKALDNYRDNFNFIRAYRRYGDLNENELISKLTTSGYENVIEYINSSYENYNSLNTNIATEYAKLKKNQYASFATVLDLYNKAGCIQNNELNESACTRELTPDEEQSFFNAMSSMNQAKVSAKNLLNRVASQLKSECWSLSAWLADPDQYEQEKAE